MKHNVYFEGNVQSLSLNTEHGEATIGVITPGKYTFSTATEERMVITSGDLNVKLPGENWKMVQTNQEFVINANMSFEVEASQDVAYICYYSA
ncbi:MAG: pyrimidine/purine nucleoside phosphorylase [Desulfosporosinus sp.]|nr:pyrimidine/purine nucleoside phosphorylase [Desulfosporosinus sp.]